MMSEDRTERDKTLKDMFRKYLKMKATPAKDAKSPASSAAPAHPATTVKTPQPKSTTTTNSSSSASSTSLAAARAAAMSEKSCRTEDEDAEVFENEAGSRPAVTRMRAAKIKWKSDEKKSSSKSSDTEAENRLKRRKRSKTPVSGEKDSKNKEKPKEPSSDKSKDKESKKTKPAAAREAKTPMNEPKKAKTEKPDLKDLKLEKEPASKMETKTEKEPASKMEKNESPKTEKESKEPASKMEKLEPKQNKEAISDTTVDKELADTPSKMEKLDVKMAEPASEMECPKSEMETEKKETLDPELVATSASILDCLKRNQLLESALNYQETATMTSFFGNSGATPSALVVSILDKAITFALNMLEFKPDELDVPIDNRMRELLLNRDKAKTILLEVLLSRSAEFLPISWGGRGGDRGSATSTEDPKTPPPNATSKSPATPPEKK